MKDQFTLLTTGFLSGVAVLLSLVFTLNNPLSLIPGIIYGVITGAYFNHAFLNPKPITKLILWTLVSTFSFFVATSIAASYVADSIGLDKNTMDNTTFGLVFALSGLTGAFVLAIGFHFIFHRLQLLRFILVPVTGSITAFAVMAFEGNLSTIPLLWVVWQTIVTFILAYPFSTKLK